MNFYNTSKIEEKNQKWSPLRLLFILTAIWGGAIFWLAPHLPMTDLPQLAGQVAVLKSLVEGNSPWHDLFRINFFTPYLVPYALWLALTFLFSITISAKILLTFGYLFFISMCICLRKIFGSDERLDWLFIPCYFGIGFKWGFITFLLAAPFGLLFIIIAKQYTDNPSIHKGIYVTIAGFFLFFCHGFVFIFVSAIVFLFLLLRFRLSKNLILMSMPYFCIIFLCIVFFIFKSSGLPATASNNFLNWGWYRGRPEQFLLFILGKEEDRVFLPIALFLLAFPFLLGSRLKLQLHERLIPFSILLITWFSWPSWGNVLNMDFAFVYQRFAIFSLPFYALLFQRKEIAMRNNSCFSRTREAVTLTVMVLICWTFFAVQSVRVLQFAKENQDFDQVVAVAEPKHLALYLVFDGASSASNNSAAYRHFPAWYQVENNGTIEFNFASYLNQVVIYRAAVSNKIPEYGSKPFSFRWKENNGDRFYYIFVRHTGNLPANIFADAGCQIAKIVESGTWSLYRGCAS